MRSKHVFVSVLDLPELLPFTVKEEKQFDKSLKEQEQSMKELIKFIDALEKNYKEGIYYIGQDMIGEKFLQRFIFQKEGFLEIMYAAPAAICAHFVNKKKAEKFVAALKKTLEKSLPKGKPTELLIESVGVEEEEETLTVETWQKLREIREESG